MTTVRNTQGYAHNSPRPRKTLTVTFITDMVPGAYHDPIDLMNWIAQNPYVAEVRLSKSYFQIQATDNPDLFWNDDLGWGSEDDATFFVEEDTKNYLTPTLGVWVAV